MQPPPYLTFSTLWQAKCIVAEILCIVSFAMYCFEVSRSNKHPTFTFKYFVTSTSKTGHRKRHLKRRYTQKTPYTKFQLISTHAYFLGKCHWPSSMSSSSSSQVINKFDGIMSLIKGKACMHAWETKYLEPIGVDVNKRTVTEHSYSLLKEIRFGHYMVFFLSLSLATSWVKLSFAKIECLL